MLTVIWYYRSQGSLARMMQQKEAKEYWEVSRDVPDSDLAGHRISGKAKHGRIPDIRPFSDTGYPAGYPVSKVSDIRP